MSFRDVGVRLVSDCGAHHECAGTSRQFHSTRHDAQEDGDGETNALDHDRVEGGSADKSNRTYQKDSSFSETAEIVQVAHTIPQERVPKRFLEQIIKDSTCGRCATLKVKQVVKTVEVKTLIQTTINLAKINQTCLIEIPQIQCSAEADSPEFRKSHRKSRTRKDQSKIVYLETRSSSEHTVKMEQFKIVKNIVQRTNPNIQEKINQVRCRSKFAHSSRAENVEEQHGWNMSLSVRND